MTIERPNSWSRFGRSIAVIVGLHALILVAYVAITLVPGNAQTVTVIMPGDRLRSQLPRNISVVSWSPWAAQLASNDPHFVRALYQAGAFLVLPTLDAFCIGLQ